MKTSSTAPRGLSGSSARHPAAMGELTRFDRLPTSFGVFKPVGCVMIGLANADDADDLVTALADAGWSGAAVQHFTPVQVLPGLEAMIENEGLLADFGYEIVLVRRYVDLSRLGHHWVLVAVAGGPQAAAAAEVARHCHAALAIHYRLLTSEELI